ncbi:GntR family transcriptional regulator [Halodurantibacterium flavum]|uniref:GntR family transcriptional regulator n=1 Tax=Halodurantibacterium flavum TaxID=1382802 RepID=A0ABW4RZK7_9RHOB
MLTLPDKRLALQAYEQILEFIMNGTLKPGELLNERRLADVMNVSRTPVRDALLMLEGEGILLRLDSRRLQVKQIQIEDYLDALQIRLLLEPSVARHAAGRVPADRLADLRAKVETLRAKGHVSSDERHLVREIDDSLHGLLCEATGNPQLTAIIVSLRRRTLMFDLRSVPERLESTCDEHLAILDAVARGEGEKAAEEMTAHIAAVRSSIINRLHRR